jgi:acetyltransferase-like isoleucine patch superfamily enzyme
VHIRPPYDGYAEVDYLQFRAGPLFRAARAIAGVLTWPIVLPLALLSRGSMYVFQTCSELLALVPYVFGLIVRYEFYRFALESCGTNVVIGFGTVFNYREVRVGSNVLIGRYNVIHHCDFGDYVLTGERCTFLSGAKQHNFRGRDTPMALQAGQLKHIVVARDVWIGSHSVVMESVGEGSIVGAGSIVAKPIPPNTIAKMPPLALSPRFPDAG